MKLMVNVPMLNQLIFCKKYNRLIRLAALLLAGVFVFFIRCLDVTAEDSEIVSAGDALLWAGTVSSGDAFVPDPDDGISLLMADSYTFTMPSYKVYLFSGEYTPISNVGVFATQDNQNGFFRVRMSVDMTPVFQSSLYDAEMKNLYDIRLRPYMIVSGEKYYPFQHYGFKYYFEVYMDFASTSYMSFGYEGYLANEFLYNVYHGSAPMDPFIDTAIRKTAVTISMTCKVSVINFTRIADRSDVVLRHIEAALNTVNSSLSTIYNQIVNDNKNIYNLISGFSKLVGEHFQNVNANLVNIYDVIDQTLINNLKTLFATNHADLQQIHKDIATTLTNNLRTWFATNHSDLETLHTDNTTFLARFNTVYTDLRTRLTTWFNRQHEDFLNLIEETTEGYDNSAGQAEADSLSGSVNDFGSQEGAVVDSANANLDSYDPMNTLTFGKAFISGVSFVKTIADKFFIASGSFDLVVNVAYTLVFISMVVGIWRFARGG